MQSQELLAFEGIALKVKVPVTMAIEPILKKSLPPQLFKSN